MITLVVMNGIVTICVDGIVETAVTGTITGLNTVGGTTIVGGNGVYVVKVVGIVHVVKSGVNV